MASPVGIPLVQEVIYQRALAIELIYQNISFVRELEMPIYYREEHIGTRRVDFFVEDKIMLELKAVEKIEGFHKAQVINYCENTILLMVY